MKEYYRWKDTASAVSIFLIFVAHFGNYDVGFIRPFIVLFANPVFFMIAGLFAWREKFPGVKDTFVKNAKRLLIPYCGWGAVNIVFYSMLNNWGGAKTISQIVPYIECNLLKFSYGGSSWFLVGLFICRCVYDGIARQAKNKYISCIICFWVTVCLTILIVDGKPILEYGYSRGIFYMFFYSLGPIVLPVFQAIYENIRNKWKGKSRNKKVFYFVFLCTFFFSAYIYFEGIDMLIREGNVYIHEIIKQIFIPVILSVFLILSSFHINSTTFESIGRNTIIICGSESMLKSFIPVLAGMLELKFVPHNSLECVLYATGIFIIANQFLFPMIHKKAPFLTGKAIRKSD